MGKRGRDLRYVRPTFPGRRHKQKDNCRLSPIGARSLSPIQSSRPKESNTGRISQQNSWLGRPVGALYTYMWYVRPQNPSQ